MIEATCSACGTLNRVSEANVSAGARFITCGDCKTRIAIPATAASTAPPPAPKLPPATPAVRGSSSVDLSDLPAPKRASALGPPPAAPKPPPPRTTPARPSPRAGIAAALDPELPAPKAVRAAAAGPLDFDDPSPPAAFDGGVDLPAPKRTAPRPHALDPLRNGIVDLPAPKIERSVADLPAPKLTSRRTHGELQPVDPRAPAVADLPAPRESRSGAIADPAPRGPIIADLPAPRHDAAARATADPPAPRGFFDDLPQPKPAEPDLPAPKGFFEDLPQPALRKSADLPAPKGFFEDLPQPKAHPTGGATDLPAPKGFFEDLPQPKAHPAGDVPEVPAPKGFFDDIPGLPHTARPEVPAPKGFFDDVPGLPHTARPEAPAPKGFFDDVPGLPHTARPEPPAPQGYFDNVPARSARPAQPAHAPDDPPRGFFGDPPQRSRPPTPARTDDPPQRSRPPTPARTDDSPQRSRPPTPARTDPAPRLVLDPAGPDHARPSRPPSAAGAFDDFDPSRPAPPSVRFAPTRAHDDDPRDEGGPGLELEESPTTTAPKPVPPGSPARKSRPEVPPEVRARRRQIALVIVLAIVALAGGGYVMYRRHVAAVARAAAITEQLGIARTAYAASDSKHWQRAAAAARRVVDLDDTNPEGLGIGAEALLASALDDGTAAGSKIAQAHAMLDTAATAGISRPELARARALASLAAKQADAALAALQPLATAAPQDPALALYVGWALATQGDARAAIEAYDRAAAAPAVKLSALYGRGRSRLALGDLEAASADFKAVLELAKDHLGAQVGLAAAIPSSAAQRREATLLEILAHKDIAAADPRAQALAWSLAGDAAMRAGRYDVARERFRKALTAHPQDLSATAGLAETELRDGKVPAAAELTARALGVAKDNVAAQLVQSEIEIKQRRLTLANQRVTALANRPVPLTPLEAARLSVVTGRLREAEGKDDEAADAYVAGAKAARGLDLEPMLVAVGKLATMAQAAVADRDQRRAAKLRGRADELLGGFATQAERDPQLALTLGVGYLEAGDADKAEPWLRRAIQAVPGDAEARFQLGRALLREGRLADALETLNTALGLDPARVDIAADLARTYELVGRDTDAAALYTKLLDGAEPSLEIRARGGRFFARTGARDKAAEQGKKILAVDPRHAAGLYLKGEGLLADDKPAEAKQQFQRAIEVDRDPQYLDALGRAAEALAQGGDRDAQELALRSYQVAADAAPKMLNPLIGQGRVYVARREAAKALQPLIAASRLDPKNPDVKFLLGAAYQEIQQPAMALQSLEESAKLSPSAETYWRIGQIERDANHGTQAVAALATATRLAAEAEKRTGKPVPWLTDALYYEGRINFDMHNEPAARAAWGRYLARRPPVGAQLEEVKQTLATALR